MMTCNQCNKSFECLKDRIWRWERYKVFFQVTIFRYFVLWFSVVPVIAMSLSNLPDDVFFNFGGQDVHFKTELPFSWQLLWLSSLFFVVALGIYYVFCPDFIKKYNDYGEYSKLDHDYRWMSWEACYLLKNKIDREKFTGRVLDKGYAKIINPEECNAAIEKGGFQKPIVGGKTTDFFFESEGVYYKLSFPHIIEDSVDEYADKGMFYEIFGRYSASRSFARALIMLFLMLSLFLFVTVLIQHIFHGAMFFYDWLRGCFGF